MSWRANVIAFQRAAIRIRDDAAVSTHSLASRTRVSCMAPHCPSSVSVASRGRGHELVYHHHEGEVVERIGDSLAIRGRGHRIHDGSSVDDIGTIVGAGHAQVQGVGFVDQLCA